MQARAEAEEGPKGKPEQEAGQGSGGTQASEEEEWLRYKEERPSYRKADEEELGRQAEQAANQSPGDLVVCSCGKWTYCSKLEEAGWRCKCGLPLGQEETGPGDPGASGSDSSVPLPREGKLARAVIDKGKAEGGTLVRSLVASGAGGAAYAQKDIGLWDDADWEQELAAWSRLEGSAASGLLEPEPQRSTGSGKAEGGKAAKGAKGGRNGGRGRGPNRGERAGRQGKGPGGC